MTSVSQQGQQQPVNPTPATQYRVSRILEISEIGEDVQQHEDLVFDMRGFSPVSSNGRVNAIISTLVILQMSVKMLMIAAVQMRVISTVCMLVVV